MARIVYGDDFTSQKRLLENVNAKNTADGANSPLTQYLNEHNINLPAVVAIGQSADTHDVSRALLSKTSENNRQLRDNRFDPVFNHVKAGVQFLKSLYKGNSKSLGGWGITVDDKAKVSYPAGFAARVALVNTFYDRHNSYPAGESPLQPFLNAQGIDVARDLDLVSQAQDDNTAFDSTSRQAENERELRDNLWSPVFAVVRELADFLRKLYPNNPRTLGLWGYTVDESPQKPKLRTTRLKLGESITLKGIAIGSTLTNTGPCDLHIYKGTSTKGTPFVLHTKEQYGLQKGFSTVSVINPSMLETGSFTAMML